MWNLVGLNKESGLGNEERMGVSVVTQCEINVILQCTSHKLQIKVKRIKGKVKKHGDKRYPKRSQEDNEKLQEVAIKFLTKLVINLDEGSALFIYFQTNFLLCLNNVELSA